MSQPFKLEYQEIKSPLQVQLELTTACNHTCRHCYNFWREAGDEVGTLSVVDLTGIIDNLAAADVLSIVFTGGEPLLVPELLFHGLDLAQKYNMPCTINSNLSLLTPRIAKELARRRIPILTSFPSYDPQTFDMIVHRDGAFERVFTGIKTALSHDVSLYANMVVMRQNLGHVYDTGRFLKDIGLHKFAATRVHPAQACTNFDTLKLTREEIVSISDELLRLHQDTGMLVDTVTCAPKCLYPDMKKYGELIMYRRCSAGKREAAVGADGGMRPCAHSDEVYGNVKSESVTDVWKRMREWRDGSFTPDGCKICEWVEACGTGCRVDAKYFYGTKTANDPYMVGSDVKISFPDAPPLEIRDDVTLFVNPDLRFRHEDMGVFLVTGVNRKMVTQDTALLMQSLSGTAFQVRDLIQKHDLDPTFTRRFFAALVQTGFVLPKDGQSPVMRQGLTCQPNA